MRATLSFSGGSWPTPAQTDLLVAATGEGEASLSAWRRWQAQGAFADIDVGSLRLVPLLYWNLKRHGAPAAELGRYHGLFRRAWYQNTLLFHAAGEALAALESQGVQTLVVKGLPLAKEVYPEIALRPMGDFDVCCRPEAMPEAIRIIEGLGWKAAPSLRAPFKWRPGLPIHAWTYHRGPHSLDLHWRAMKFPCTGDWEQAVWNAAEPLRVDPAKSHTLCPTDQLIHTCLHGVGANEIAPLRWIVDATLIAKRRDIDWPRLVAFAQDNALGAVLHRTLAYLAQSFAFPMPAEILERLGRMGDTTWQRGELRVLTRRGGLARRFNAFTFEFVRCRRSDPFLSDLPAPLAYARYLRSRLLVERLRDLPLAGGLWLAREMSLIPIQRRAPE